MVRKPMAAVIAAVSIVLAVGCPPQGTGPEDGSGEEHAAAKFSRAQHIGAMMTVRAYAELAAEVIKPLDLMPLAEAADILAAEQGVRADSRKRRAIAELAAYQRVLGGSHDDGARSEALEQALDRLGMTPARLNRLEKEQREQYPEVPEVYVGLEQMWLEKVYVQLVPMVFPKLFAALTAAACQWAPELPDPTVTPWGVWPLELTTKVSVNKPLTDVAPNIDPQRWDECSEFWDPPPNATHLAEWLGKRMGPLPSPPEAGTHQPDLTLLHENFTCGHRCSDTHFDLLLCVTARCDPATTGGQACTGGDAYSVFYDLPQGAKGECECAGNSCPAPCNDQNSLWWIFDGSVGSEAATPCIDKGVIKASRDSNRPGYTIVEAKKRLDFDAAKLTNLLSVALSLMLDEMNQELGELACCYGT